VKLRPYQEEAVAGMLKSWREFDRALGVGPTGCGKTTIAGALIRQRLETNQGPALTLPGYPFQNGCLR
jgi:superfamily II DNA or RNA helicase